MKRLSDVNINTPAYWDEHQTALDFGLRQQEYKKLCVGKSVVELGCGLSPFLSKTKQKIRVGVDFSPVTVQTAQRVYENVVYVLSDAARTPFVDRQFDTVVAGEVIEHMTSPKGFIEEMMRLARKRLILSTPILEEDDPEHLWQFSLDDLRRLLPGCTAYELKSKRFPGRSYLFAYLDL